jgi:hypothetical protein
MENTANPYAKKIFSLALLFNSVLTLQYAFQILAGFYSSYPLWKPFPPLIIDGSLFWGMIPVSILNFYPAISVGQAKCSRLWFHHYVYGIAVFMIALASLLIFTSVSFPDLFAKNITDININVGRFFMLGGLTMIIDDLPDVSGSIKNLLRRLKSTGYHNRGWLHRVQLLMGVVAVYFCLAVMGHMIIEPAAVTLANTILVGTLLVTSLTSIASFKRRVWLNLKSDKALTSSGNGNANQEDNTST